MSFEYYPTGALTALKMAMKFTRQIEHICDPSAGKGNLLRHLDDGFESVSDEDFRPFIDQMIDGGLSEVYATRYAKKVES